MGKIRRRGARRFLMGSMTRRVIESVDRPVLVVTAPPTAAVAVLRPPLCFRYRMVCAIAFAQRAANMTRSSRHLCSRAVWRWRYASTALVVAFLCSAPALAGWDDNQCVMCHQTERLPISLGHSFEEWRASEHARAGVGCEKCHGGDPGAKEARVAHQGVLPALDPNSMVSTKRLAATCGACHAPQYKEYATTVHAKQVQESGRGATCYTCHGSMATSLPSAATLSARCAECHKKPIEVQAALIMLSSDKIQLWRTRRTLDEAKTVDPAWYEEAIKRFHEMERDDDNIQLIWHTFKIKAVLQQSRDLLKLIHLLDDEAQVRIHRRQP